MARKFVEGAWYQWKLLEGAVPVQVVKASKRICRVRRVASGIEYASPQCIGRKLAGPVVLECRREQLETRLERAAKTIEGAIAEDGEAFTPEELRKLLLDVLERVVVSGRKPS